ncbi:hypothetical protein [Candidatus Poriferisodalis sp.]|uniref:hypothetical protein n=1 Tax=Candidatus Poriferisodalis sp. TaxID=3101277 RepID=UPI003AF7A64C
MARKRRSPRSRVTPKGTRPQDVPRLRQIESETQLHLRMLGEDALRFSEELSDIDEADVHVSRLIGCGIATDWNRDGVSAGAAMTHARSNPGPAGAVIAAALASYGPHGIRDKARGVLDRHVADGVAVPEWATKLGMAEPVRAVKIRDEWDEHWQLFIEYARPDGSRHELSFGVHPFCLGVLFGFSLQPAIADKDRNLEPGHSLEELTLAHARTILEPGLEQFDQALRDLAASEGWDGDWDDADWDDAEMRSLVGQRMQLLPAGAQDGDVGGADADLDILGIVEFVAQPLALGEHVQELSDLMSSMATFSQVCRDRDMYHWTPLRVETFVALWLPSHGWMCDECQETHEHPPYEEWFSTVESAFPRWLRFVAQRHHSSEEWLEPNLAAARSSLRMMRLQAIGSLGCLRVGAGAAG